LKRLVFIRQLTLSVLLSVLIASCTKDLSPIGIELLDEVDLLGLGYTDTVTINAYSIPEDSIYTRNLTYTQIGSMNDPIFGQTTANFYTQLFITKSKTRFGVSPVFDSAYLYLPYKGSFGDTLSNMTLRVYSLTESIIDSLHSYSNTTLSYDQANPIGEITFQPRPHDSSFYEGSKHLPMLRIPINSNFGNTILNADTTSLNNNVGFVKYFKGICIVAEPQNSPGKGAILTFSVPTDYSRIAMYYHNLANDTVRSYSFAITSDCSRFQNYDHDGFSQAIPALRQQLEGDTLLGSQFLFAQGLSGSKIKIQFPYLDKWFENEKVVINDAQLILGNASVSEVFENPFSVTLRGIGESGTTSPYSIVDESEGSSYFDGYYTKSTNSYRFRITRYVQQVLTGKVRNNGLHLIIPSATYSGSRLVLKGTESPQSDMKLYLRYTRIK